MSSNNELSKPEQWIGFLILVGAFVFLVLQLKGGDEGYREQYDGKVCRYVDEFNDEEGSYNPGYWDCLSGSSQDKARTEQQCLEARRFKDGQVWADENGTVRKATVIQKVIK